MKKFFKGDEVTNRFEFLMLKRGESAIKLVARLILVFNLLLAGEALNCRQL
jgi:hypothetical protein